MPETEANSSPFFGGFLQFDVQHADIAKNLARVRAGLQQISASSRQLAPGIVVLPELWATDFAYDKIPEIITDIPNLLQSLQELSAEYQVHLAGSLPEYAHGSYYNTLYITGPAGIAGTYRKQQMFAPMAENSLFSSGTDPSPIQTSLGAIGGLVCYDLRFPELLRSQVALGANLLIVSAQWPAARINHWRILVQARAIENQIFVVAANRSGTTNETLFGGHSMIVGPDGTVLLEAGEDEEYRGVMLDQTLLTKARSLFCTGPK